MKRISILAGLAALAALAVPQAALAHGDRSARSVGDHVRKADVALDRYEALVESGRGAAAARRAEQVARALSQAGSETDTAGEVTIASRACLRTVETLERIAESVPEYRDEALAAAEAVRQACSEALAQCRSVIQSWHDRVYEAAAMLPSEEAAQAVREWADQVAARAEQACEEFFGTDPEDGDPGEPDDPEVPA